MARASVEGHAYTVFLTLSNPLVTARPDLTSCFDQVQPSERLSSD
jgi:hypothetical protein